MFASRTKRTITLKDDEGNEVPVTYKKLSARALEKAAEIKTGSQAATLRAYGGDIMRVFRDPEVLAAEAKKDGEKGKPKKDPRYEQYDRHTVLEAGVDSPESVVKGIADLDEETAEKLYRAIVDLSVPPADEAEAAQGKS